MKVNFEHLFVNEYGTPITIAGKPTCSLKDLALQALLNVESEAGKQPGPKEKRQRYDLCLKIKNFGSQAELTPEDVELIKVCIGMGYPAMLSAPAEYLLEGKEVPEFRLDTPELG